MNMTIFQVYAPTSTVDPQEIECFYVEIQTHIDKVPGQDVLIHMGDWNAKVGEIFEAETTGRFGLGERNEAGTRLIDFCIENELVITSTLFEQPKRRLYTWTSPDRNNRKQIDFILCRRRLRNCINSAKTLPGVDCGSDYKLLVSKFKLKLKTKKKTSKSIVFDLDNVTEDCRVNTCNRFQILIHEE